MTAPTAVLAPLRRRRGHWIRPLLDLLRPHTALPAPSPAPLPAEEAGHPTGQPPRRHLARPVPCLGRRPKPRPRRLHPADAGMTTAEYAVGTVAACGFAAVLYKVVTSEAVANAVTGLIQRALDAGF
jgi:hypothetical protein